MKLPKEKAEEIVKKLQRRLADGGSVPVEVFEGADGLYILRIGIASREEGTPDTTCLVKYETAAPAPLPGQIGVTSRGAPVFGVRGQAPSVTTSDPRGPVYRPGHTRGMNEAWWLLRQMMEEQRGLVLCWFCRACHRYVGPGDSCTCERDD